MIEMECLRRGLEEESDAEWVAGVGKSLTTTLTGNSSAELGDRSVIVSGR